MIDIGKLLLQEHFYESFLLRIEIIDIKEVQGYHSSTNKNILQKLSILKDYTGYQSYQLLLELLYYIRTTKIYVIYVNYKMNLVFQESGTFVILVMASQHAMFLVVL